MDVETEENLENRWVTQLSFDDMDRIWIKVGLFDGDPSVAYIKQPDHFDKLMKLVASHTVGRFYFAREAIAFEEETDATMFKLAYTKRILTR